MSTITKPYAAIPCMKENNDENNSQMAFDSQPARTPSSKSLCMLGYFLSLLNRDAPFLRHAMYICMLRWFVTKIKSVVIINGLDQP